VIQGKSWSPGINLKKGPKISPKNIHPYPMGGQAISRQSVCNSFHLPLKNSSKVSLKSLGDDIDSTSPHIVYNINSFERLQTRKIGKLTSNTIRQSSLLRLRNINLQFSAQSQTEQHKQPQDRNRYSLKHLLLSYPIQKPKMPVPNTKEYQQPYVFCLERKDTIRWRKERSKLTRWSS